MKKTFMKIMATALSIMMLAVMIPFGASATLKSGTDYKFTLKCDKTDFEFTVYQLATINTTTGEVTVTTGVADAVKTAIENGSAASVIIGAADATSSLGNVSDTFQPTATSKTKEFSTVPGYYYVKCTDMPEGASAASSLIVTQYTNDAWVTDAGTIDVGGKVGSVNLDKKIIVNDNQETKEETYTSAGVGNTVTFKLKASVPGNVSQKLTDMIITDTMEAGLSSTDVNIVSVKQGSDDIAYTKVNNIDGVTFGIQIDSDVLKQDSFYQNGDVVVTFTTKVTPQATVGNDSNDNTVGIQYSFGDEIIPQTGPTVQVFTFNVVVTKVAKGGTTGLKGAKFGLYKEEACTTELKVATTGSDGKTNFGGYQLDAGTYYVKEIEAPKGYILDPTPHAVTITPVYDESSSTVTVSYETNKNGTITIENVNISAPQTGGMGTIMFTIGGAALIAAAGVMFVMLKRKKTSK